MSVLALPDDLRAITMYAEYAHAVVTGDKTIETRSRPCSYRGWVAIHAAASVAHLSAGERRQIGRFEVERDRAGLLVRGMAWPYRLPLGAIVAVARVVDCLWVRYRFTSSEGEGVTLQPGPAEIVDALQAGGIRTMLADKVRDRDILGDELLYGDYTPGRYALLLEDVTRLRRPVPAKGNQAVPWRVPEDVAAAVREQVAS